MKPFSDLRNATPAREQSLVIEFFIPLPKSLEKEGNISNVL
jgi:hypothetical protein